MAKRDILRVKTPLYGVPVTFVCGFEAARKLGLEPMDHWGAMASTLGGEVYFTLGYPYCNNPNTLAHEAVHCGWRILDLVGIDIEAGNHEALAYLVGWLTETAKTFFDKNFIEQ